MLTGVEGKIRNLVLDISLCLLGTWRNQHSQVDMDVESSGDRIGLGIEIWGRVVTHIWTV